MDRKLLLPVLVFALGVFALSKPVPAHASVERLNWCGTPFSADCRNKSLNDLAFICNSFCPQWTSIYCWDTGEMQCNAADH